MAILWGETPEARLAARRSFEKTIETLLIQHGSLHIKDLLKRIGHETTLITDYQRVLFGINELVNEGKIIVDENNRIHLTMLTIFDEIGFKEIPIWEILHKEEDILEKKEIIRKYSEINPFA